MTRRKVLGQWRYGDEKIEIFQPLPLRLRKYELKRKDEGGRMNWFRFHPSSFRLLPADDIPITIAASMGTGLRFAR